MVHKNTRSGAGAGPRRASPGRAPGGDGRAPGGDERGDHQADAAIQGEYLAYPVAGR